MSSPVPDLPLSLSTAAWLPRLLLLMTTQVISVNSNNDDDNKISNPPHLQGQRLLTSHSTTDPQIRDFLVEKQAEWAVDSRATTVTNKMRFIYAVADLPRGPIDFHGNELNSERVVNGEIAI
ncbi:hypothetical protein FOXG_19644 [Fusarium oxysporum f. sp. lycopersici 4287]|uniref:Uncharacterized protein n=1 Tax=Fusarium oxysporum f. sp. lycopersici (strain 4287 / CBS 123668 / FGSC 9935 / NRRL 34936) TaxID=426428 RepID=A0A0J9V5C3_FUSO4|nr:hypothetical protein FOXG_19644 [Fusarium oxysporum f. sp. lycopersici 4287]KNB06358.1 hypothetical protein FOXG_19644 [Fusarium oxysporum f. sp. lycopersici 4287]